MSRIVYVKDAESDAKQAMKIEVEIRGLSIQPEATGTFDGDYPPILIEFRNGYPVVVIWENIDQQEPTHTIYLRRAFKKEED